MEDKKDKKEAVKVVKAKKLSFQNFVIKEGLQDLSMAEKRRLHNIYTR